MLAAPSVSAGNLLFRTGRFHLKITKITPRNEIAFSTKATTTPAAATINPASPGPVARARLNSMPFSASAGCRSSFFTSSGKIARHVGDSTASPSESASVSNSSSHGVMRPENVTAASATATRNI